MGKKKSFKKMGAFKKLLIAVCTHFDIYALHIHTYTDRIMLS